jgi:hypothetical protein
MLFSKSSPIPAPRESAAKARDGGSELDKTLICVLGVAGVTGVKDRDIMETNAFNTMRTLNTRSSLGPQGWQTEVSLHSYTKTQTLLEKVGNAFLTLKSS